MPESHACAKAFEPGRSSLCRNGCGLAHQAVEKEESLQHGLPLCGLQLVACLSVDLGFLLLGFFYYFEFVWGPSVPQYVCIGCKSLQAEPLSVPAVLELLSQPEALGTPQTRV